METDAKQRVLKVSSRERAQWDVKVPSRYEKKCQGESVVFEATISEEYAKSLNEEFSNKWHRFGSQSRESRACYAGMGHNFSYFGIHCYPREDAKHVLPWDRVRSLFLAMGSIGCLPDNYTLNGDKHLYELEIPSDISASNASIYALLCLYRWVDSYPNAVWAFSEVLRKVKNIHPMQAFQYVSAGWIESINHNFLSVGNDTYSGVARTNPLISVAAVTYFNDKSYGERYKSGTLINSTIDKICAEICPMVAREKEDSRWGSKLVPAFSVERPTDLLYPGFSRLYKELLKTKKEATKLLTEIYDEKEKT